MTRIFIDDERLPPEDGNEWKTFKGMQDFMEFLDERTQAEEYYLPEYISFDHDLGEDRPNGYDIAKKLVELDMDGYMIFPPNFTWVIHSENPVGRDNINGLLRSYLEFRENYYGDS